MNKLIDNRFETKNKQTKHNETKRTNKQNDTLQNKTKNKKQNEKDIIILIIENVFDRDYLSEERAGHEILFAAVAL